MKGNTKAGHGAWHRKGRKALALLAAKLSIVLLAPASLFASTLKSDEDVVFFPQSARWDDAGGVWRVAVHGWVFEPEMDSLWRRLTVSGVAEMLEIDGEVDEESEERFKARAWRFIVDNERGKDIAIRFDGGDAVPLAKSRPNGHFESVVTLETATVEQAAKEDAPPWLRFEIAMPEGDGRRFQGEAQLLCPRGLSVISDIDDTIKVSNVLDKQELLANTFLRDFKAVERMPDIYRQWQAQGAAFHYVSGSPWQLYPPLAAFMTDNGFPGGSFHLRYFRFKDSSFFNLFASAEEFKVPAIEEILQAYPERKFFLVGDSGEKDPEVYGEMARRHPDQITGIMIRNVTGEPRDSARMRAAFREIPNGLWMLFGEAADLNGVAVDGEWFGDKAPPMCRRLGD